MLCMCPFFPSLLLWPFSILSLLLHTHSEWEGIQYFSFMTSNKTQIKNHCLEWFYKHRWSIYWIWNEREIECVLATQQQLLLLYIYRNDDDDEVIGCVCVHVMLLWNVSSFYCLKILFKTWTHKPNFALLLLFLFIFPFFVFLLLPLLHHPFKMKYYVVV